jgi:hypothetical protein
MAMGMGEGEKGGEVWDLGDLICHGAMNGFYGYDFEGNERGWDNGWFCIFHVVEGRL